jgi:Fic family protein
MTNILFFIAGIWLGYYLKSRKSKSENVFSSASPEEMKELRAEAQKAVDRRTEDRKQRILDFLKNDAKHEEELKACNIANLEDGITRENVEKLLSVSDQTARKYLNELEDENKIKQIGERGRGVHYVLRF